MAIEAGDYVITTRDLGSGVGKGVKGVVVSVEGGPRYVVDFSEGVVREDLEEEADVAKISNPAAERAAAAAASGCLLAFLAMVVWPIYTWWRYRA